MDEEKGKNPSNKKPKKQVRRKKPDKPSKPDTFPGGIAALSALFAVNQASMEKEGEGIKFMSEHMQEYMSNYILIGYTMEGNPVHVTYAPTPKDYDCLNTGLQRYIMEQGPHNFGP